MPNSPTMPKATIPDIDEAMHTMNIYENTEAMNLVDAQSAKIWKDYHKERKRETQMEATQRRSKWRQRKDYETQMLQQMARDQKKAEKDETEGGKRGKEEGTREK